MDVTKIIYYVEDEETPYLIKIPLPPGQVRLRNFKDVLPKPLVHGKFYFKSFDEDVGVVKEEIAEDEAHLPVFNQRVVSWVIQAGGQQQQLCLLNKSEQLGHSSADSTFRLPTSQDDTKQPTTRTEDAIRKEKLTSVVKPEVSERDPRKVMRRKQPNGSPQEFKVSGVSDATESISGNDIKPVGCPKSPSFKTDSIKEGNKRNSTSPQKQETKHVTWSDKNRDSKPVGSGKKQESNPSVTSEKKQESKPSVTSEKKLEAKSAVITEKKQELKPSETSEKKQEPKPPLSSKDTQPVGCSEKKQDAKPSKRPQADPTPRSPRETDTKSTWKTEKRPGVPEVTKGLSAAGNQGTSGLLKRLLAISNMKIPQSECNSSSIDSSQVHSGTKNSRSNAYGDKGSRHGKVTSNKSKHPNNSKDDNKTAKELDKLFEEDWDIIETDSTSSGRKSGSHNSATGSHNARKTSTEKAKINNDNSIAKVASVKEAKLAGNRSLDSTVSSTVDETFGRNISQSMEVAPPIPFTRIPSTIIPNVLGPPYCWGWSLPLPPSTSSPLSTAIETATSTASSLQTTALGIVNASEPNLGLGTKDDLTQSLPQSQIQMDVSLHSRLTVSRTSTQLSDPRITAKKRKESPDDIGDQVPSKKMRRYYDINSITLAA